MVWFSSRPKRKHFSLTLMGANSECCMFRDTDGDATLLHRSVSWLDLMPHIVLILFFSFEKIGSSKWFNVTARVICHKMSISFSLCFNKRQEAVLAVADRMRTSERHQGAWEMFRRWSRRSCTQMLEEEQRVEAFSCCERVECRAQVRWRQMFGWKRMKRQTRLPDSSNEREEMLHCCRSDSRLWEALPNWPRFPGRAAVISHRGVRHVRSSAGHEQQEVPSLVRILGTPAPAGISGRVSDGVSERLPLSWNVAESSVKQTFAAAAATIKPRHH